MTNLTVARAEAALTERFHEIETNFMQGAASEKMYFDFIDALEGFEFMAPDKCHFTESTYPIIDKRLDFFSSNAKRG